jgi:hypothetical protein
VIKLRRVRWVKHVACMVEVIILVRRYVSKRSLGDLGIDGTKMLKGILNRMWTGFIWLSIRSSGGLL